MKMKGKKLLGLSLMSVACIGLACSFNAMPPMGIIKISALSILQEIRSGGTKDAAYRAFLSSLDKRAEILLGADVWRNNAWKGYATYSSPGGGLNIVFFEKDCGQKASDKAGKQSPSPVGGGSGGGGSGGGSVVIGGGCYGNCGGKKPIVIVGDIQKM